MDLSMVIAIVHPSALGTIEKRLRELRVRGITVSKVEGYGEYANFFADDWLVDRVKLEIFAVQHDAEAIAEAIAQTAQTNVPGSGIVAILPVQKVLSMRTRAAAFPAPLTDPGSGG